MLLKIAFAAALLSVGLATSSGAVPAAPTSNDSDSDRLGVQTASFWAQPYPYGYRWRVKPCVRRICPGTNRVRVLGSLTDRVITPMLSRIYS